MLGSVLPSCIGDKASAWTGCIGDFTTVTGDRYIGEFRSGMFHGRGALISRNGTTRTGVWFEGEYRGPFEVLQTQNPVLITSPQNAVLKEEQVRPTVAITAAPNFQNSTNNNISANGGRRLALVIGTQSLSAETSSTCVNGCAVKLVVVNDMD